jgi:tetratricopeptide (TPR) repeat protein
MKVSRHFGLFLGVLLVCGGARAGFLEDGWAAYDKGNYEEAHDLFSKAFRSDPGSQEANFALAEASFQKKNTPMLSLLMIGC